MMRKQRVLIFVGFLILSISTLFSQTANNSNFGVWNKDADNLPYFELNFRKQSCPWCPFSHFQGTGYNSVLTNQWGAVNLFSTEYGLTNLTPAHWISRGGFYPMIEVDGELISLIISELDSNKIVKYGVGYTEYSGILKKDKAKLQVKCKIATPFNYTKGFFAEIEIKNLSEKPLSGKLSVRSDIWIKPTYDNLKLWYHKLKSLVTKEEAGRVSVQNIDENFKEISLSGSIDYKGSLSSNTLRLTKNITLNANEKEAAVFYFSYNEDKAKEKLQEYAVTKNSAWKQELKAVNPAGGAEWTDREITWSYAQLLSMCFYDKSLNEYFIHLGGYGIGESPATPGTGFSMREVAETAMILAYYNPELAKSSLRWMAKTQLKSGDLKRGHFHFPLEYENENQRLDKHFPDESDTEIWFLIACGEYYKATKDTSFFREVVPFRTINSSGDMWKHMVAGFHFIKNDIGTGKNGHIKMLHGDWNDYLSKIGAKGNGESVMNTAMMCRALLNMKELTTIFDNNSKREVETYLMTLQKTMANAFDTDRFIRAYDDNGKPVGDADDRLFINSQSWAALGKCGTSAQRKTALLKAVELCSTPIGMMIISKPYSSPTPDNISNAPIPAGEGENAGIWPQTTAWMIWALAEEGLTDIALKEWKKSTLAIHSALYPEVPFGIFNGPDCYSSHYANEREGWTQIEMFNRMIPIPMNPIIAWQSFSMKQIRLNK
jgi:hypothetical protein